MTRCWDMTDCWDGDGRHVPTINLEVAFYKLYGASLKTVLERELTDNYDYWKGFWK